MILNGVGFGELDKGLISLIHDFMTYRADRENWKPPYQIWNHTRDGKPGLIALLNEPSYFHLADKAVAEQLRIVSDKDLSLWVDRVLGKMTLDVPH